MWCFYFSSFFLGCIWTDVFWLYFKILLPWLEERERKRSKTKWWWNFSVKIREFSILQKSASCIYWHYHMVFIFQFVNIVYHIDSFAYFEESLHPWNKPDLIMAYELFNVVEFCLLEFCWEFFQRLFLHLLRWSYAFYLSAV